MKNYGIVHGAAEQAVPLIIGKDTIYVHTNITKLECVSSHGEPAAELYSYDEIQYDKDEYIQLLSEKSKMMDDALTELILGGSL